MKKIIIIMGILNLLGCKTKQSIKLSEKLEKIGYFNLIDDTVKKKYVKEKIDFEYENNENEYIGKGWFIIPNDGYISSVYKLKEYGNISSTSDFKSFEIWGEGLVSGDFESTLEEIQFVFNKNGLLLDFKDNNFNQEGNSIRHSIVINNKLYEVFVGTLTNKNYADIIYYYISKLKEILNDTLIRQKKDYKVILLTQPENIYFILLSNEELNKFKKVIEICKNKIEE